MVYITIQIIHSLHSIYLKTIKKMCNQFPLMREKKNINLFLQTFSKTNDTI